jgi:hypothetical protein
MANFSRGSRYIGGKTATFRNKTVIFPPFFDFSGIEPVSTFDITVEDEFRPDLISYSVFGQTNLGWYIMLFNGFDSISSLKAGTTIYIPPKDLII